MPCNAFIGIFKLIDGSVPLPGASCVVVIGPPFAIQAEKWNSIQLWCGEKVPSYALVDIATVQGVGMLDEVGCVVMVADSGAI